MVEEIKFTNGAVTSPDNEVSSEWKPSKTATFGIFTAIGGDRMLPGVVLSNSASIKSTY